MCSFNSSLQIFFLSNNEKPTAMKITEELLIELGFERLLIDYFRKNNFGIMIIWKGDVKKFYHGSEVIEDLEDLKRIYKEKFGEELKPQG